jgi:glyoxylase-like metal-dependent hydrolase (beta-lactamase superfamily II)
MKASYFKVAPGVWGGKDIFVNYYFVKENDTDRWVLVDTGLSNAAKGIKKAAAELFGENSKPDAIILTHGHSDHTGSVKKLAAEWSVPVYAHYLELPYLNGHAAYPPSDPTVGGGLMTRLSVLFPRGPFDLGGAIEALPENGTVPFLSEWKWIHTPGHAPGHISLYRQEDKVMIVGDAFVTTKNESAWAAIKQPEVISGPPKYFTQDWVAAEESVKKLAAINPNVAATGHGKPMEGPEMQEQLRTLADNFKLLAIPPEGRYVAEPALFDASGVLYIPPKIEKPVNRQRVAIVTSLAVLAGVFAYWAVAKSKKQKGWRFK